MLHVKSLLGALALVSRQPRFGHCELYLHVLTDVQSQKASRRQRILVVTLLHALELHKKKRGLASLCVGVGQGMSMCIERLS